MTASTTSIAPEAKSEVENNRNRGHSSTLDRVWVAQGKVALALALTLNSKIASGAQLSAHFAEDERRSLWRSKAKNCAHFCAHFLTNDLFVPRYFIIFDLFMTKNDQNT